MNLFSYSFQQKEITFELHEQNVMVNATQMAKIFGKEVTHFLENDGTERFMNACLNTRNSEYLGVEKREDLVYGKQKSGTWMHRILALKFAGWLNPDFEVWVYSTIDGILFDHFRRMEESLKQSAKRKIRIDELDIALLQNPEYLELKQLLLEDRQAVYKRGQTNRNQLDAFREMYKNN